MLLVMSPGEMALAQAREALTFRISWAFAKALGMAVLIVRTSLKGTVPRFMGLRDVGFTNTESKFPSDDAESHDRKKATGQREWPSS